MTGTSVRNQRPASEPHFRNDLAMEQFGSPEVVADYASSHEGNGPEACYFRSRITAVSEALASSPGGELLDVGCGPGMMARKLLDTRSDEFRITAVDSSPAMVEACASVVAGLGNARAMVGSAEELPFDDNYFDVALALGVLEYTEIAVALAEIARVVRPGGLVLATMLNPSSPYRFVEWRIYWPLLQMLRATETALNVPPDRRHGAVQTGIRAYRERTLRKMMAAVSLYPIDSAYYDVTPFVPPIDRLAARWLQRRPEQAISRGRGKSLGTAYLVVAQKV